VYFIGIFLIITVVLVSFPVTISSKFKICFSPLRFPLLQLLFDLLLIKLLLLILISLFPLPMIGQTFILFELFIVVLLIFLLFFFSWFIVFEFSL